jgi:hypothetical protein
MDAEFQKCLEAWAKSRLVELDEVLRGMRKSEYWTLAVNQCRCNASEKVIWQLLDGARGSAQNASVRHKEN